MPLQKETDRKLDGDTAVKKLFQMDNRWNISTNVWKRKSWLIVLLQPTVDLEREREGSEENGGEKVE